MEKMHSLNDYLVSKKILINNHATDVSKGKIKGHLPFKNLFGFRQTFKKIIKNLGIHLTFKTANLQGNIFTTIATDIKVTINSLYLYVPILIPNTQTQVVFN